MPEKAKKPAVDRAGWKTYSGPEWAWGIIFETLELDSQSPAFDRTLRRQIARAKDAVIFTEGEEG